MKMVMSMWCGQDVKIPYLQMHYILQKGRKKKLMLYRSYMINRLNKNKVS